MPNGISNAKGSPKKTFIFLIFQHEDRYVGSGDLKNCVIKLITYAPQMGRLIDMYWTEVVRLGRYGSMVISVTLISICK